MAFLFCSGSASEVVTDSVPHHETTGNTESRAVPSCTDKQHVSSLPFELHQMTAVYGHSNVAVGQDDIGEKRRAHNNRRVGFA